jgi:predicted transcriptional regulator
MKALSLKLDDGIFLETERLLSEINQSRNAYFNEAIAFYNKHRRGIWLDKQYAFEAEDGADDVREMLKIMEPLDPHLLDEYEPPIEKNPKQNLN